MRLCISALTSYGPTVVLESLLLPNSNVTEDFFMEAYKMAIERNDGNTCINSELSWT